MHCYADTYELKYGLRTYHLGNEVWNILRLQYLHHYKCDKNIYLDNTGTREGKER